MMPLYQHRVRNHEVDSQGFLFNSRYLEIADVAMTEFFRSIGWPYPKLVAEGTDPSVVSAVLSFKSPLTSTTFSTLTSSAETSGIPASRLTFRLLVVERSWRTSNSFTLTSTQLRPVPDHFRKPSRWHSMAPCRADPTTLPQVPVTLPLKLGQQIVEVRLAGHRITNYRTWSPHDKRFDPQTHF